MRTDAEVFAELAADYRYYLPIVAVGDNGLRSSSHPYVKRAAWAMVRDTIARNIGFDTGQGYDPDPTEVAAFRACSARMRALGEQARRRAL